MRRIDRFTKEEMQNICRDSYSIAEVAEKIGYSKIGSTGHRVVKKYIEENDIDISHFTGQGWNKNNFDYSRFQNGKRVSGAKNALIYLRGRKCEVCGNTEWMGKEIPLVIHHIDGNHLNNEISNLQISCPNCHAQTDNYCGRNIKNDVKYSDEQFVEALRKSQNVSQALISMGINYSAGCYYERAYQLIKDFNIDMKEMRCKPIEEKSLVVNGDERTNKEWAEMLNIETKTFNNYINTYGEDNVVELIKRFIENPEKLKQKHHSVYFLYMSGHKCPVCGKITHNKKYCSPECMYMGQTKCKIPEREELKCLIRTEPFSQIAKMFGISTKTVREWCKKLNLPHRYSEIKNYTDEEWKNI